MKPLLLAVLLSVGMLGCGKKEAPKPELRVDATAGVIVGTTALPLTDAQKIALLRAEAHKRGLRWQVGCAPSCGDGDCGDETFFASAEDKRTPSDAYILQTIEAGARDWWAEYGPTQADAAYALYLAIQQSPNMKVRHEEKAVHKKLCPPELRGE